MEVAAGGNICYRRMFMNFDFGSKLNLGVADIRKLSHNTPVRGKSILNP